MKKSTNKQLELIFFSVFGRRPRKGTEWNIRQNTVENNEFRFLKKLFKLFIPRVKSNKLQEFEKHLNDKIKEINK